VKRTEFHAIILGFLIISGLAVAMSEC